MNINLKIVSLLLAVTFVLLSGAAVAKENSALSAKHKKLVKAFPEVEHLSGAALQGLDREDVVIFDVREPDEFNVSHIEEAIWVSPKISTQEFLSQYSDEVKGKTVVLYCSVGHRSSVLADKIQDRLIAAGSETVYNLEGGLFKWHNENMPLVMPNAEPTEYIHPYNFFWGRMVNQKSKKRYEVDLD